MGYLQAVCKPEMWTLFKEYCETNFVIPADTDFEKGLEYLRETYYKKNDVFILKMKAAADTFKERPSQSYRHGFTNTAKAPRTVDYRR